MKILHVIASIAQVRGGPSQSVLATVKALRSQGIDVEIATTNDNGSDLLDVPLYQRIEYEQVPVWFFPRFSPPIASLREFAFSREFTAWLWQSAPEYDLLHIHAIFSYPSTVAMAICRIKNIPYVVSTIGQLCEWCFQHRIRKKQIYMALIERTNLNNSQALHLTSEKEQQELSKFGLQVPNFILPLGLSLPTLVPGARQQLRQLLGVPDDEPIILAMSRLHPVKGLDYLIPALGQLIDRRFTFVLAGTGAPDYEAEIDTHIVSAGIRDRTYRSGFVSGEMKDLLLQGSDLFALTSHSESFGVAVLEALGSALPVLITPGVALASVVEQHQLGYVSELEVGAIASAVQHFLSDPQTAREMGIQARQLVREKYTWERIASNLSEAYTTILKQDSIPIFY